MLSLALCFALLFYAVFVPARPFVGMPLPVPFVAPSDVACPLSLLPALCALYRAARVRRTLCELAWRWR